jgi:hypothetical protein
MWNYFQRLYNQFLQKRAEVRKDRWADYALDNEGFTQISGEDNGKKFLWSDVQHVGLVTTSDGPFFDDVFYIIQTENKNICLTQDQATKLSVLDYFNKLPGFRWESVIEAMGSTTEAVFHCWDVSWSQ